MENKVLRELAITEYQIIGSYNDDNISNEVISDIDAQDKEIYDNNDIEIYNRILDHFREVFKKFKDDKRIEITDFKCGVKQANVPYRWKYKDIMKGYLYDDNNEKVFFIDQLQKYSTIKIDTIAFIDNNFMEITMNYYFNFGDLDKSYRQIDFKEVLTSIKKDVDDYRNEGNYYKSLKRLNSYFKLQNKSNKKLLKLINSNYGKKAKEKSNFETLLYVMENKSKFNKQDIKTANKNNLSFQEIKDRIEQLTKEINNEDLKTEIDKYKLW